MDRVRSELLPPVLIEERHRAARQAALIDEAARASTHDLTLSMRLGRLLVQVGCRLEAAERRQTGVPPAQTMSLACGCPE